MQTRSLVVLAFGLVIAFGTAWSLKQRMASGAAANESTQVLVAAADIGAGDFVRSDYHLVFTNWPAENITGLMLTNKDVKVEDFEGAVARREIPKGEPIQKSLLVKSTEGGFMSAVLEPGKRAVSIAVDSTTGNAGFIFPGDFVDLILTHSVETGQSPLRASETFIENVRVLAVDQMLTNPDNKAVLAKTVTLEVSPKEAEEITVAKDLGKISLSLRSLAHNREPTEQEVMEDAARQREVMTFDDVLNAASADQLDTPAPVGPGRVTRDTDVSRIITPGGGANMRVRVIRGNQHEDIEFGPAGSLKGTHDAR